MSPPGYGRRSAARGRLVRVEEYTRSWRVTNAKELAAALASRDDVDRVDLVTRRGRRQSDVLKAFVQDMKVAHGVA